MATARGHGEETIEDLAPSPTGLVGAGGGCARSDSAFDDPKSSEPESALVGRLVHRGIATDVDETARARARIVYGVLDAAARIRRAKSRDRAGGIR